MSMHQGTRARALTRMAILSGLIGAALVLTPLAGATGSGYNVSFSRAAGSTNVASVDLVSASSSDPGGNNLTIQFTVSGTLNLHDSSYFYFAWFGGTTSSSSVAYASFSNNSTAGSYVSSSAGGTYGAMLYTLSHSGSTLSFSIAKSAVPGSSSFGVNVEAIFGTVSSGSYSWLGTDYTGAGGGTCTSAGCTSTATTNAYSNALIYGLVGVVLLVIVVVVVIVVVMKRKKTPPAPPVPPVMMAPPPPPPNP